jgi:hypothetical protein
VFPDKLHQGSLLLKKPNRSELRFCLSRESAVGDHRGPALFKDQNACFARKPGQVIPIGGMGDDKGVQMCSGNQSVHRFTTGIEEFAHKWNEETAVSSLPLLV